MTITQTDDLAVAAVTYLSAITEITDLLGSDDVFDTWIFRDDLLAVVENTGKSALVVRQQGSWAEANQHNTMRFPRLIVEMYVDPPRDTLGNAEISTVDDVADHLFEVIDFYLHRARGGEEMWGTRLTLGSYRAGEPDRFPWADVDGTQAYRLTYNVTMI